MADAHELLANLLMARNQVAAAVAHFREVVRLRPDSAQAQFGLGSALVASGEGAAGIPYLRRALLGGDAGVREEAGRLLREIGVAP